MPAPELKAGKEQKVDFITVEQGGYSFFTLSSKLQLEYQISATPASGTV
jgi:hypothetical protein